MDNTRDTALQARLERERELRNELLSIVEIMKEHIDKECFVEFLALIESVIKKAKEL